MKIPRHFFARQRPALGLLDDIMSLMVVGILVVLFGSIITTRDINRRTSFRAEAAALADEEIGALHRLSLSAVPNQTNGAFINVLYNAGSWGLITDTGAGHSTPNIIELKGNASFANTLSGRLLFPAGSYSTAAAQYAFKVLNDSPNGWGVGYVFWASDAKNGYRARLTSTTLYLEKMAGGTVTNLVTPVTGLTVTTNTWHTLKLVMDSTASPEFQVFLDGTQLNTAALTDATYTSGPVAILGWGGAHLYVDDAQTTVGTTTATWNFDGSSALPPDWVRVGLNDLPDGSPTTFESNGLLTVAPYPTAGATNLKQATVTVQWQGNGLQSYTATTLLGNSTLGQ